MRGIQAMTLMLSMLLLAGCGIGAGTEGAYTVYCRAVLDTAEGSDAVYAISADAEGESDERIARMLLEQMMEAPGEACESPLPEGTRILELSIDDGLAVVDLSEEYAGLSGMDLTVADACITLTLCQLPTVERVSVLAEGEPLPYRERESMTVSDVLLSQMDEEVRTLRARLFFLDPESGALTAESRSLQLYEGQTKAEVVLEALLQGPEDPNLAAVLPENTRVLSTRVEEGVCYVNFSKEFLENMPQSMQQQENVIYSVVKSLCSISDIQAVQISVEGMSAGYYGGVDISVPLS